MVASPIVDSLSYCGTLHLFLTSTIKSLVLTYIYAEKGIRVAESIVEKGKTCQLIKETMSPALLTRGFSSLFT